MEKWPRNNYHYKPNWTTWGIFFGGDQRHHHRDGGGGAPQLCERVDGVYSRNTAGAVIRIKCFGHAGDGNLHAYVLRDNLAQAEWEAGMPGAMDRIYEKVRRLNGQVSGEQGIGYAKRGCFRQSVPATTLELMRGYKQTFGPKGVLNPHKVFQ